MSIFGEYILLQVSEVHLCADLTGFDFSQVNYREHFVTRVRKNSAIFAQGVDGVALDNHEVSTLQLSSHAAPLSCSIYNKTREIKQKSQKPSFMISGRKVLMVLRVAPGMVSLMCGGINFTSNVTSLHQLKQPIEGAYVLLDVLPALWSYAAGSLTGGPDGLPDGWLRYVVPDGDDTNRSRWPVHPVWQVVQIAFMHPAPSNLVRWCAFGCERKTLNVALLQRLGISRR